MALLAGGALWSRNSVETTAHDTMHFDVGFPPGVEPLTISTAAFAMSPDGKAVAMVGVKDSVRRLFVRRFGSADTIEVAGSIGAQNVEFSPDGASVALVPGSGSLTTFSLADQQRTVLTPGVDLTSSLVWSSAGIVFVREGALWVVSAEGGAPRALTVLDAARHEVMHSRPIVLPGARVVLFASLTSDPGTERIEAVARDGSAAALDLPAGAYANPRIAPDGRRLLVESGASVIEALDLARGTRSRLTSALPAKIGETLSPSEMSVQGGEVQGP